MELRSYYVTLVVGAQGLNDRQHRWVQHWLGFIAKGMPEGCHVTLQVIGLNQDSKNHYGIPRDVWNKVLPSGCVMQEIAGVMGQSWNVRLNGLMSVTKYADEVWCCPATRQTHYFSKALPTMLFHHAMKSEDPPRFKWVPPWIETEVPDVKVPKGRRKMK